MFETKVMVAPNSPTDLANPSTAPAITPGKLRGRVMVAKVLSGDTPRVRAAPSSRASTSSIASRIARTTRGRAMMPAPNAAPVRPNMTEMPNQYSSQPPTGTLSPNSKYKQNPVEQGDVTEGRGKRNTK